jgi:hypothetical protein
MKIKKIFITGALVFMSLLGTINTNYAQKQKKLHFKVPRSIPKNIDEFVINKIGESDEPIKISVRTSEEGIFEIVDYKTKAVYLMDSIYDNIISEKEFIDRYPDYETPYSKKKLKSGQTAEFLEVFTFCSASNFSGDLSNPINLEVDVPAYWYEGIESKRGSSDLGANSHYASYCTKMLNGELYDITIQPNFYCAHTLPYTILPKTLQNYDDYNNVCIKWYSGSPNCELYLPGNFTMGIIRYVVDEGTYPAYTIKGEIEHLLDDPRSYLHFLWVDTGENHYMEAGSIDVNQSYQLTVEKYRYGRDVLDYEIDELTLQEKSNIKNGTFNLTSWCQNEGIDISQEGYYNIKFGHSFIDLNYPLQQPWLREHVKCLKVTDGCHLSRVITDPITVSCTKSAKTTIEASNLIQSPASVTYKAGESITLLPGFKAELGASFNAIIEACNSH